MPASIVDLVDLAGSSRSASRVSIAILLACLVVGISSCRATEVLRPRTKATAPAPSSLESAPLPDEGGEPGIIPPQVPEVTSVQAFFRADTLHVRGQLGTSPILRPYEPARAGGWALQILIDSDRTNGGYWLGFDHVVRGSEWSPAELTFVTRQITLEEQYPGGWGPESGITRFRERPRHFEVAIPLAAIGGSSREMFLAIETYAVTACSACPAGITYEYSQTVFQSVSDPLAGAVASAPTRGRVVLLESAASRAASASMDADPRLFRRAR